jgi:hypothetical protein
MMNYRWVSGKRNNKLPFFFFFKIKFRFFLHINVLFFFLVCDGKFRTVQRVGQPGTF